MKTFREIYCERHGVTQEQYEQQLVRRGLYWQARPVYWLLGLNRDYTSPDYEFVRGVGELRYRCEFRNEAAEYHYHPRNRGWLRTLLRLRVSAHRLQRIFESEIGPANPHPGAWAANRGAV